MNRSGSQKALLVLSIISIVLGALILIGGLMAALAGGAMNVVPASDIADAGLTQEDVGVAGAVVSFAGVLGIIAGIVSIIEGVLGVRAANDANKIMPVWVLAIIGVAMSVISVISAIVQGQFGANALTYICSLAGSGLMFWIANNIKNQR